MSTVSPLSSICLLAPVFSPALSSASPSHPNASSNQGLPPLPRPRKTSPLSPPPQFTACRTPLVPPQTSTASQAAAARAPSPPVPVTQAPLAPKDPWPASVPKPPFYDFLPLCTTSLPNTEENLALVVNKVATLYGFLLSKEAHEGITCQLLQTKGVRVKQFTDKQAESYVSTAERDKFVAALAKRMLNKISAPNFNGTLFNNVHYIPIYYDEALTEVYDEQNLNKRGALFLPYNAQTSIKITEKEIHFRVRLDGVLG